MDIVFQISIVTLHLTIADIIVQPEYTRPYAQYQPVQRQFLLAPHQYRTSGHSYGQYRFIPMYLSGPQINNPLVGSTQNNYVLSRYAYPKHLHAVKIGGHSIVHPSYLIGQQSANPSVSKALWLSKKFCGRFIFNGTTLNASTKFWCTKRKLYVSIPFRQFIDDLKNPSKTKLHDILEKSRKPFLFNRTRP